MDQYYKLLRKILEKGTESDDRTGTGTVALFGEQMRFDISKSFPLLTGKKTSFKMIATELIWILSGDTNVKVLNAQDNHIWDEWATNDGCLGPIYGHNWRSWDSGGTNAIDQIQNVIDSLKSNPKSRRHIVSAWNVAYLPDESKSPQENANNGRMALSPCHSLFQFHARRLAGQERIALANSNKKWRKLDFNSFNGIVPEYALSCQLYQRSADTLLGVPYNIASYSLLTCMIAQLTNMVPEEFIWTGGDCHVYLDHIKQTKKLLWRYENNKIPPLPSLRLNSKINSIDNFTLNDFEIVGYEPLEAIKADISV